MRETGYSDEDFLEAEKEMAGLVYQASQKYKVESNAMFAKLSEIADLGSGKADKKGESQPAHPGFDCCGIELSGERGFRFNSGPEGCNVMIVAGWIPKSMASHMRSLYEKMDAPRHVIGYGECAVSGGPWWQSYNIMQGIDEVLPVDVYVVGCPPKPRNLLAAFMKLQDKVGGKLAGSAERSISENIRREKARRV